ncbi:MAG: GntR family transcriptional regulator [Acidimicrobiales bacterium]
MQHGGSTVARIDRSSPVPLYHQIARQLQQDIETGCIKPGSRLDNEIELAEGLSVSRPTVRQAIKVLVDQGLLVRRRGVGTIVVPRVIRRPIALTSLFDDLSWANRQPSTKVLSIGIRACPAEVGSLLSLGEGARVIVLDRLRYAEGEAIAMMRNYLPTELISLDSEQLTATGLYETLRSKGILPRVAEQTIGARRASTREARLLGIPARASVLTMTRIAFDDAGRAIEYGSHIYPGSRYSFQMSLVAQ